jgi:exonuclease III
MAQISRRTQSKGAGPNPFETPRISCTVMGAEIGSNVVMVRDSYGNEFTVDASLRPKAMGFPLKDERWVLAKINGRWTFDLQIASRQPLVIEGDREGMHPVVKQMLNAMAQQGLVFDITTDSDPVDPELDDDTDPVTYDPGEEPLSEDDYDYPNDDPYYTEEVLAPGTTTDDDAVPGSRISSDLITVVTYNQVYSLGVARATKDILRLCKFADLIGMQECVHSFRTPALNARPSNWGMYRPAGGGIGNVILWNKDVFKNLEEGTHQLSSFDGPGTKRPARAVNWVKFEHRPTGVVFIFADTHLENAAAVPGYYVPNFKPDSPRHIERFKEQMVGATALLKTLTERAPVLLVGDLNVKSEADLRIRNPNLPTAAWGRLGMRSNWDLLGQPPIGSSHSGNTIDQKYLYNKVPGQFKFVSSKVVRGYYSDHKPVVTKIRIKNFA